VPPKRFEGSGDENDAKHELEHFGRGRAGELPPAAAPTKLSIPIGRPMRNSVERPGSNPIRL